MSRLALVGSAALLVCAACENLSLPARSAQVERDTSLNTPAPPPKPARGSERNAAHRGGLDPAEAAARLASVRRGLRRLVVAEETYYAENGVYTDDIGRIGYAPETGTDVRFLWLTRAGWAASGSDPDLPGRDCVIFVGRAHGPPTTMHDVRQGREGAPVCDGVPSRPAPSVAPQAAAAAEAPAPSSADTGSALDGVDPTVQMRVDLRNLVRSQDTYYGTQGIYSRRTEPFALQYLWHKGVKISILSANDAGWSARAEHVAQPGKSCVIWLGPVAQRPATEAQKRTTDQPGTPVCDS
ncbi:MAG TPA: hypothetical protein VFJ81_13265 [Gemmatimonadales bacterium]|nr:hypothetical protein [Gemmatimonadales bacterium]